MKTRLIPTLFALVRIVLMDYYITVLKFNLYVSNTILHITRQLTGLWMHHTYDI